MLDLMSGSGLATFGETLRSNAALLATVGASLAVVALVVRLLMSPRDPRTAGHPGVLQRVGAIIVAAFTTNWQLTLLATTAFVLSVASGWTTWDGMRNFTGEPVLSFLVTFGIQGVMLIIAWLIGESFASGMGQRSRPREGAERRGLWASIEPLVGMLVGLVLALGLLIVVGRWLGLMDMGATRTSSPPSWLGIVANNALYLGIGLLLIATLLINQRSDIIQPYVQSARVIARNAVLWVMFLACMATSVFFSFDSLFSSIFPQDERRRAADIRAQRQVAGVVNDIGSLAVRRQAEEAELLFKSAGWQSYEQNLARLARSSLGAETEIERYFVERMEAHKTAMAAQQERITTARSGQASLSSRKTVLADELSRLKSERPGLAAELAEKKTELENRNKAIDLKRVEAMAEERGAEGTLKQGKGPVYRQRMSELDQMRDAIKIQEERVRDSQRRMTAADTRIAQIEREVAQVDGDVAKLRGEAETAEQRIAVAEATRAGADDAPKVDPARVRVAFERAHADFRQQPNVERLSTLALQCTQLHAAMLATPATKERVRDIDCDPKQATEAAGRVFALNQGLVTFATNCSGGNKLPQTGGTDAMLSFGRKCLQDSGLPSNDAGDMSARIASIDLNRDDKAHRFVVTWNAFSDGNRLAYLALAIAIAIDSLVFMSGLFGANAVRSPLTDIEDRGSMTADQLEATIDAALHDTAHPRQTLSGLLRSLHPISGHGDYTSEIFIDEHDPLAGEMRQVLAMGITIGAVKRFGDDRAHYLLHSGLVRYFAVALSKSWKVKPADVDKKELVQVVGVALMPEPERNADIVLSHLHPVSDSPNYAAEIHLNNKIEPENHLKLVRRVIGAGATIPNAVFRENKSDRYFVSSDFYRTLLLMKAGHIPAWRDDVLKERELRRLAQSKAAALAPPVPLRVEQPRQLEAPAQSRVALPPVASNEDEPDDVRGSNLSPAPPREGEPYGSLSSASTPIPARAAPLEPAVSPAPSPVQAFAHPHDVSLGDEIRAEIIQLAGLHAWSERDIKIARTMGAGSEPEQALRRLAGRAPRMAELVGQTIDDNRKSIDEAHGELRAANDGNRMYLDVLETVANELIELMPVLMLSPGGPYQQILEHYLIAGLERQVGESELSLADDALLQRARAQAAALRNLADGASDRYARLVGIIDQYDERGAAGAAAKAVPRSSVG